MAHVGAPNLHLHLTMHFRLHCQLCAHLPAKTPTLTLEMVSTAGRFPLLGLVPLPLVGRRSKPCRQARCLLMCPPLGLVLLPLVGRHCNRLMSAMMAASRAVRGSLRSCCLLGVRIQAPMTNHCNQQERIRPVPRICCGPLSVGFASACVARS